MPNQMTLNPFVLIKFVLWIVVVITTTFLLRHRKVTSKIRLAFLIGGVLLFGFIFGLFIPGGMNPDPVTSLRTLLTTVLVKRQFVLPIAVMLVILLLTVWVSNKSICGWGCQLGLLQDLLHRAPLPKWRPPFWLSNAVRIIAFVTLVAGLIVAGLDWIGIIDPFQLFSFNFTLAIGLFSVAVLVVSLFVYRPWCQFLCPFGLIGWLVEQVSLFRPRINRETCKECQLCVKACPGQAMADFYAGKKIHTDCFACGACIEACPQGDTLGWWNSSQAKGK
ncbi:MAG: 4Fe-4S binding protein [Chloroflexi bacterium]|nr:4Fe-4S binding protein [Chloroflexota bacterium]